MPYDVAIGEIAKVTGMTTAEVLEAVRHRQIPLRRDRGFDGRLWVQKDDLLSCIDRIPENLCKRTSNDAA